jgi:hypothetical protein
MNAEIPRHEQPEKPEQYEVNVSKIINPRMLLFAADQCLSRFEPRSYYENFQRADAYSELALKAIQIGADPTRVRYHAEESLRSLHPQDRSSILTDIALSYSATGKSRDALAIRDGIHRLNYGGDKKGIVRVNRNAITVAVAESYVQEGKVDEVRGLLDQEIYKKDPFTMTHAQASGIFYRLSSLLDHGGVRDALVKHAEKLLQDHLSELSDPAEVADAYVQLLDYLPEGDQVTFALVKSGVEHVVASIRRSDEENRQEYAIGSMDGGPIFSLVEIIGQKGLLEDFQEIERLFLDRYDPEKVSGYSVQGDVNEKVSMMNLIYLKRQLDDGNVEEAKRALRDLSGISGVDEDKYLFLKSRILHAEDGEKSKRAALYFASEIKDFTMRENAMIHAASELIRDMDVEEADELMQKWILSRFEYTEFSSEFAKRKVMADVYLRADRPVDALEKFNGFIVDNCETAANLARYFGDVSVKLSPYLHALLINMIALKYNPRIANEEADH